MRYRINIHAHSVFSDGSGSPYTMAMEAKRLKFSALVLTDHLYGNSKDNDYCSITNRSYHVRRSCCHEASSILPIIEGLEVPVGGEEVLLFGTSAIKYILDKGKLTIPDLKSLRRNERCAIVLCHPHISYEKLIEHVDAYELYNSGGRMFKHRKIHPDLASKQSWANSDAHSVEQLKRSWNVVNTKIKTEEDLIKYIHGAAQPKHYAPCTKGNIITNMFL